MRSFIKTNSSHSDFAVLVAELDADLAKRDGEEHAFYSQFNSIDILQHVVICYENDVAIGCGAIKEFSKTSVEVKRMYVPPKQRGKGIASQILRELENWASEMGYTKCVLETGKRQPEAIALYTKNGYTIIPNYDPYKEMENSVCFEKNLSFI
mgnify:CR=1 FL=1